MPALTVVGRNATLSCVSGHGGGVGVRLIDPAREPEVDQLQPAIHRNDCVGGLEIPMDDAAVVRVGNASAASVPYLTASSTATARSPIKSERGRPSTCSIAM
jgi:hypothetical protein